MPTPTTKTSKNLLLEQRFKNLKILLFLGFHLSALGGLYCDHGNKLMWGNYSSRTGTFFCIQLHSRNVNHILGINEFFFFHDQKPSGKDILRGFISSQFEASLSETTLRDLSSPALFSRELRKLYAGVL